MRGPWLKFYPSDWRADPALRMCSIGARGLWMEMLCLMHEADPQGSLLVNGKQISTRKLASLCGCGLEETESYLAELEETGVFSREDDGTIYSRRIRRDTQKADFDKQNGKRGGNPNLRKGVKGGVNPPNKGGDKAQKPEARYQNPDKQQQLVSPEPARSRHDYAALENALREASGLLTDQTASARLCDVSAIVGLLDAGVSLDGVILPVLRSRRGKCQRVGSWDYFIPAIQQAVEKHTQSKSVGLTLAQQYPPPAAPIETFDIGVGGLKIPVKNLEKAIHAWRENPQSWIWMWGPEPPKHPKISAFAAERGIPLDREAAE